MKKALFLALSLAFLLTACGETTLPDTSEQNSVDNTQETSLPESCLLYYGLGNVRFSRRTNPSRSRRMRATGIRPLTACGTMGSIKTLPYRTATAAFPSPT